MESKSWQHLVVQPAPHVDFFTPKQVIPAGTPRSPDPPLLFQPLQVRGLKLHNRILVAPMAQYSAVDGHVNQWQFQNLGSIAMRGPGLTWTEAATVHPNGRISANEAGIWKDSHIDSWKPTVDFVHSQSQKIGIQLWHGGWKSSSGAPFLTKGETLPVEAGGAPDEVFGPSTVPYSPSHPIPKAMTVLEIREMVKAFGEGAARAVKAGFDAINIGAAHGYLIHSFMSPVSNHRTDQYGGSFENCIRFLLEIIDSIRANIPDSMPIFLRISATEWLTESRPDLQSWTLDDSIKLAKIVADKVDALDVSSGGISPDQKIDHTVWSNTPAGVAYQAPLALKIKEAVGDKLLVQAVGNIKDGKIANELLEAGVDLVAVGRHFLKNPGAVFQFAEDLNVDVEIAVQHGYVFRGRGAVKYVSAA